MNGEELDDVYPLIAPTPTESPNSATDNTGVQTSRQNRSPQSRSRPLVDNPWICTADEEEAEVSLANHPYYADNYQTPAASPSPRVTNNQHQNLHQEIQLLKTMIAQKENERKRKLSPKTPPAPEPAKAIPITSAETADMTKNEANQMLGSEHMAMELSTSDENQVPLELTANEDIEQISPVSAGESSDSYETSSDEEETEQDADHIEEEEDPVMREMEHRTKELKAQLADIQHRIKELDKDKAFEDTEKLKLKVRADLLRKRLGLTTISEPVTERRQSPTFDALDNNEDDKSDAMSLDSDYDGYEEKEFSKNRAKVGPAAYSNMPPYPPAPAFYQSPAFTVNAPPLLPPNPAFVSMPMPPAIVTPTRNIKRSPLTTKKEPNVPPRQQDIPLSQPTRGIPVPQVDTNDYPTSFTAEMNNLKNYFYDVQELIKIRFSNDKTVETAEEQAGARRTGRVSQLAYVDGMVISFDSVILHKKENDTGKEEGVSEDDQCLDSVLLRILRLKDKSQTIVDKDITSALSEVIKILPRDIEALITDPRHWGDTQLRDAKELLRKIAMAFPHVELLWTLFAELSLYCHGATEDFGKDVQFIFDKTPVFDVHWQTMRVMSVFPNWRPIRGDFMAKARWSKSGDEDKEYERKSQIATEFLLRIMRYQGLRQVLKNLRAADDNYINENDVEPFSLEETQARVQLTDHDMYIIWMTVLYYYVCQNAPSMLCHHWFKEFVAKGEPSWSKPLFTIDWNAIASQRPLTRRERFGTVNILLSMLRFFTAKATRDETKRPYMVATWQTLLNFLANTDCYKRAGTLVLLRSGMKFTVLQPEILDTALTLQSAMGEHQQAIKTISNTIADCSLEKQLMIAYRAAYLLKLSNNSSQEELQQAANLLSIPLQSYFDFSAVILAPGEPQIDFVRRLYMGALGLDPVLAAPAKKNFTSFKFQSATFAWINLMFLTQISLWLYTNDTMQYIFRQQLKTTRNSALNALRSEDSKLLVSKYANACL